jgi:hypothetical protein
MKERPILFSAPMVNEILDGHKSQTRRVVKPQPEYVDGFWSHKGRGILDLTRIPCPYGKVGDRLWVKETHRFDGLDPKIAIQQKDPDSVMYRADEDFDGVCWRPSIFMSRWMSRITLEIMAVRIERLHAITERNAQAEGCTVSEECDGAGIPLHTAVYAYRDLWNQINGAGSWDKNPWVWVIEFRRVL